MERHTWTTGLSFQATASRLAKALGYEGRRANSLQMLQTLDALELERARATELLRAYAERRRSEKAKGRRYPKNGDERPTLPDELFALR